MSLRREGLVSLIECTALKGLIRLVQDKYTDLYCELVYKGDFF